MRLFSFGETVSGYGFKVLNEREVRAISGILLLIGAIASINGFILSKFYVLPYLTGVLLYHFLISVLVNPKLSPVTWLARFMVRKQTPIYIGAVQKRFAWSLGATLSAVIFGLSIVLNATNDLSYFQPVCMLCLICLLLMYLETAFAICVGCKLYFLAIRLKLLKQPKVTPNCMGDVCEIQE